MPIDIFRHAESTANAGLPTDDAGTIPLTARGHEQARLLSLAFDSLSRPELIILSPFLRTHQTAAPTIARFPQVPREEWPIHEFVYLDASRHKGTTREQREPATQAYWRRGDPRHVDGEGTESFNQLVERVDCFLRRVSRLQHRNVAIFSHGFFMRTAFLRLTRPELDGAALMRAADDAKHLIKIPNTARMRLSYNDQGRLVSGFSPVAA